MGYRQLETFLRLIYTPGQFKFTATNQIKWIQLAGGGVYLVIDCIPVGDVQ